MSEEMNGSHKEEINDKQVTIDDIRSVSELREVFLQATNQQLEWAKEKVRQTNYPQAVQTELAMHRTDVHNFAIVGLMKLVEAQDAEIRDLHKKIGDLATKLLLS